MRTTTLLPAAIAALTISASVGLPVQAEDIDLFTSRGGTRVAPNLMLVVDNAANSNASMGDCKYFDGTLVSKGKSLDNYKCALDNIILSEAAAPKGKPARVNIGVMTASGLWFPLTPLDDNPYTGPSYPFLNVSGVTWTNRTALAAAVRAVPIVTGKASQGETFQETWAYYTGNVGEITGIKYTGTAALTGCQRNFNLFLSGVDSSTHTSSASDHGRLTAAIDQAVTDGWLPAATAPDLKKVVMPTNIEKPWGIEWSRFMFTADMNTAEFDKQNIITYSIAAGSPATPPAKMGDFETYISNTAVYGGGQYFPAKTSDEVFKYILRVLNDIQVRDSVFASASLPVSVNAQGTYENQVYMGVFRPVSGGLPRWLGNLKQYEFKYDINTRGLSLVDAAGEPAISNAGSGFLSSNAISFWTSKNTSIEPDKNGGFWRTQPEGVGGGYDSPDGENVEKGGVAQVLRNANLKNDYTKDAGTTTNPRRLFTFCPAGTGCNTTLTAAANAFAVENSPALLNGVADRTALINWMRGEDNKADEVRPNATTINVRGSIHGDVLHSRPAVINYGPPTGSVVYYGANDGVFRAVNGNRMNASGSLLTEPGSELWGMVFPEFYDKLKRLRDNSPVLKMPNTPLDITPAPQPKSYFADGGVGVYQVVGANNVTTTAYIYPTMRRGGRFLYALDVSTPMTPKFRWRISHDAFTNTAGVKSTTTDFKELGFTWSQPKVARVKGHANPVLIFGGGYDPAEDVEPPTPKTGNTMGRAIYVVDAINGDLVWRVTEGTSDSCASARCTRSEMKWSIPSDITLMDSDRDQFVDRLYVGDIGGNVWRVDLETTAGTVAPNTWAVRHIAALGCTSGACASGATPRKFFYPPEVVPRPDYAYDAVFIGSGDRERPLYGSSSYAVSDRMFMVKDTKGKDGVDLHTQNIETNLMAVGPTTPYNGSNRGFYVPLATGEKVVNAPTVVAGTVYFGTNIPAMPSSTMCSDLGTAMGYAISASGTSIFSKPLDGGGFPPTAVAGVVNIDAPGDAPDYQVPFCLGCVTRDNACNSPICASRPPIPVPTNRTKRYWFVDRR
ncbi:PilC/PilY family type IV pilus protein [Ramlibacter sp. AN1015]|uniref:pilus assembly protein n=1 Tax=Ramlibacter sp. AN1015 TaxID=3133428 RepID=UPI0030BBC7FA